MSFGASPSDIIIVVTFCKALYRKCRDAGGEYDEISREVRGLHTVLRHLKYEVEAPESPLNRDRSTWGHQLAPIIGDCDFTLRSLDNLITKYGRLSSAGSSPTSPRVLWDKVRFGSNEMDQLGAVRVKLISHKTSLTLFLDTIQLHQSGKMATTLDNHGGQLDVILDKVDGIAARMAQKNGSIMTNYDDDDKEVWKQFRRELVAEGFSSDVLQQHMDVLRAYIREIDQQGLLEPVPVDPAFRNPSGVNPEHWLQAVEASPSEDMPPSFNSLNTVSDDSGVKMMGPREENMKFPPSMRFERPKPETRPGESPRQLVVPSPIEAHDGRRSEGGQRQPSPTLKVTTSDEKEVVYFNTSGSSEDDSETENSSKRSKSPGKDIIDTKELMAMSQALTLPPQGSPTSSRGHGSFGEADAMRSMAQRPKKQLEYGSSPLQSGAIPIPQPNPRSSAGSFGTSPRQEPMPMRLAPDANGNEIPLDAKWTRINRRLVSPEVLNQDGRRYEARPEFVAVLGVLNRAEIEDLAARTAAVRAARHLRNHPPPPQPQQSAPPQPPRVIPVPIPVPMSRGILRATGRDTPSTDSDYESSDSSNHDRRRKSKRDRHRDSGYAPSDVGVPGYPNAFGAPLPPPSPMWNPGSPEGNKGWNGMAHSAPAGGLHARFPSSPPERERHREYNPSKDRDRERHRDRDRDSGERVRDRDRDLGRDRDRERDRERGERRKHGSSPNPSRHGSYSKSAEKAKSSSRWKENLTAAGIGGAAVSLLNVLSEAAEGL